MRKFLRPISKLFFSVFFDKRYLKGRLFDCEYGGYRLCLKSLWQRNILRLGRKYPFPVGLTCTLSKPENITFHVDDLNNLSSPGTYFQNFFGHIFIGKGSYIAPNVGIITSNHDFYDLRKHLPGKDVVIGKNCWIGMNSVILPGVVLGDRTIVAAGSVVTKSFCSGKVVIAGSPAQIIKQL
ncbi:acyltransferase [Pseudidiomarina sp. E22-M8]|uniref:acyltransferase n=1 Tax=Pseudidiomarina sp. E22-M8 TaxID=3424768 RepID=UPI00403D3ACC